MTALTELIVSLFCLSAIWFIGGHTILKKKNAPFEALMILVCLTLLLWPIGEVIQKLSPLGLSLGSKACTLLKLLGATLLYGVLLYYISKRLFRNWPESHRKHIVWTFMILAMYVLTDNWRTLLEHFLPYPEIPGYFKPLNF